MSGLQDRASSPPLSFGASYVGLHPDQVAMYLLTVFVFVEGK